MTPLPFARVRCSLKSRRNFESGVALLTVAIDRLWPDKPPPSAFARHIMTCEHIHQARKSIPCRPAHPPFHSSHSHHSAKFSNDQNPNSACYFCGSTRIFMRCWVHLKSIRGYLMAPSTSLHHPTFASNIGRRLRLANSIPIYLRFGHQYDCAVAIENDFCSVAGGGDGCRRLRNDHQGGSASVR